MTVEIPDKFKNLKVAFSHDWLVGMRGGEKCLEELMGLFPRNEIYTLVHRQKDISPRIESRPIHTSFLQTLGGPKNYKHFLPLFPAAIRSFRLKDYDLVISTSHSVAKAIRAPHGTPHVCYCFTPMRYAWLFFEEYFGAYPFPAQSAIRMFLKHLRDWDAARSREVTHFVAISDHIRKRIKKFYGRDAQVIYPPVDTDFYTPSATPRGKFFLLVSALVPYKRVDLAVRAFNRMGSKLVIIGSGPEAKKLERLAGPTIEFLGWRSNEEIREYYRACRALIFPGEEDFGIVPVEAQACGAPVIAFAEGGVLETVIDGQTGVFFREETSLALEEAVRRADRIGWDEGRIRKHAENFSRDRFRLEFSEIISGILKKEVNHVLS